ncbi:coagulation factor XIII A chain-like [Haliotis rubra]|uniref:coagulation factor XIII A chain-like n=1 Tax=Haliotis rubra TaxID=36100 RepID=UPI001EE56E49|nr:coagulation factor XIII A chain-like [Haliotis rubra]
MSFRSFNFSSTRIVRSRFSESWYSFGRTRPTMLELDSHFRNRWRDDLGEREITTRHQESFGQDVAGDKERVDERSEITGDDLASKLHVTNLDLNISENTKQHHTDMYECTEVRGHKGAELVVRRGQTFFITITFDRPYDIARNDITLLFSLASGENDSTVEELFRVTEDEDTSYKPRKWGATVVKKGEDVVYLPDPEWLAEAVENDSGVLYQGDYFNINGKPWYFGQFEDGILHAALHLLRKGFNFKMTRAMGNACKVARMLSKIVSTHASDHGLFHILTSFV